MVLVLANLASAGELPEPGPMFPIGASIGTEGTVQVAGDWGRWPVDVWTDDPGLVYKAGSSNGLFTVTVQPGAHPGPHLVRFFHAGGASAPRLFVVGSGREWTEPESLSVTNPPPTFDQFPLTLNGLLRPTEEADAWTLVLSGPRRFEARLAARGVDVPLEATLELQDGEGRLLSSSPLDRATDPVLNVSLVQAGKYVLRLQPRTPIRPSPSPGLSVGVPYQVVLSADLLDLPRLRAVPTRANAGIVEILRPLSSSRTLMIPSLTRGVVTPEGRAIRYSFTARASEHYTFTARAGSLGSPLAPILRLFGPAQQVLAESAPGEDAELSWMARRDGEYELVVSDAAGKGGPLFAFQLAVERPRAHFAGRLAAHAVRLAPGTQQVFRVRLIRPPQAEGLLLVLAVDLPAGVEALPAHAPPELDEVALVLSAAPEARPANQPFRVLLMTTGETPVRTELARFEVPAREVPADALLLQESDQPWLTVLPAAEPAKRAGP